MSADIRRRINEIKTALTSEDRDRKDAEAWRKAFLARATTELGQPSEVIERAEAGDPGARSALASALDQSPAFVAREGSFLRRAEQALLDATSAASWVLRETRRRTLEALLHGIAGPAPTPLEAALAHCVAMSLVEAEHLETLAHRGRGADEALDRRRSRAHARAMSAARTLATVRRLARPFVQVNVAQQQVNVAGRELHSINATKGQR